MAEAFDIRKFEDRILELQQLVQSGVTKLPPSNHMDLYNQIFQALSTKQESSDKMYKFSGAIIDRYLLEEVLPRCRVSGIQLLSCVLDQFQKHKTYSRWLATTFQYLDRYYTKQKLLKPLSEATLNSFRVLVVDKVREKAVEEIWKQTQLWREGASTEHAELLKNYVQMYMDIGTEKYNAFEQDLEKDYLKELTELYRFEKLRLQKETKEEKCREFVEKEKKLAELFLPESTFPKIEKAIRNVLGCIVDDFAF